MTPPTKNDSLHREPTPPLARRDLLKRIIGATIARISTTVRAAKNPRRYPGRFGGSVCLLELGSGEILRFGLLDSLGCLSLFLERTSDGTWLDEPPEEDGSYRELWAGDPDGGDTAIAQFEGSEIEQVEVLVLDRTGEVPYGGKEERAVALTCRGRGELLFAVGLHREDGTPDLPAALLPSDVPAALWQRLERRPII